MWIGFRMPGDPSTRIPRICPTLDGGLQSGKPYKLGSLAYISVSHCLLGERTTEIYSRKQKEEEE